MPRVLARVPLWPRRILVLVAAVVAVAWLPGVAQAATPAHVRAPGTPGLPAGLCSIVGLGGIPGLGGLCAAGSAAGNLIGDVTSICHQNPPVPESATGGINGLIKPPASTTSTQATLYDRYGMAGMTWNPYGLGCSDMPAVVGSAIPSIVFDMAKALDRVTITVYQSAASEGILAWLSGAVDRLITSLGNAIYFPYLAPVVILGAIWLAWEGLIRKRATRTIEGTIWMVLACATAIWLIGRPADFTGLGRTVSDGITQALNAAFAKLPAPPAANCVPVQRGDPQVQPTSFAFVPGGGVDSNANELWTVLVCKPWLAGEFGTTSYSTGGAQPTAVNKYGRQLLWSQAIATNEQPTSALITAKQNTFAGIASTIQQNDPAIYPLFQGKQWTTRLQIALAALFAALAAGGLVLLIAITLIVLKLGFLLLLVAGPFFLIVGTHPGPGRVIALRWAELLIGVLLKTVAIAILLSVLLYAYTLIMGASDAVLPWAIKILMIALVTVAVFIYRKPFTHLFSSVGYDLVGSRERAAASLDVAKGSAARRTVGTATAAVPGFAAYRLARWATRNPAQAASLAAQISTAGSTSALAAGAAAAATEGSSGTRAAAAAARSPNGGPVKDAASGSPTPARGGSGRGTPARSAALGHGRARDASAGGSAGTGRTAPPLELPSRQADGKPAPASGWARGGTGSARARWPDVAPGPVFSGGSPQPGSESQAAAQPSANGNASARKAPPVRERGFSRWRRK